MCDRCGQEEEYHTLVAIYKVGYMQEYNFPVVAVHLREIIYQFIGDDCSTMMYTGYIRDCSMINRPFPALAKVCCGSSDMCYVEKAKFNNIEKKNLWQDKILVVWNWIWVWSTSDSSDEESIENLLSDDEGNSSNDEKTQNSNTSQYTHTHCVVFKCTGATKEQHSQRVLAEVASKLRKGETVEVMLRPEPSNCNIDSNWERIGYIVHEALNAVHSAIASNLIVNVKFKWVNCTWMV